MKKKITVITALFLTCSVFANDCADFISDFKDMKAAEMSIQDSLISNNDLVIESLDSYADALNETSGRAYKKIVENLRKTSETFKKRKSNALEISKKFSKKMDEMIKTAEKCTKK